MRKLPFILTFVCLVSCTDEKNVLLQNEYNLVKVKEVTSFPDRIIVYEITNKYIDSTKIKNYPVYDKTTDHNSQQWIDFDALDEKEKVRIRLIINELTERLIEKNVKISKLQTISENKKRIYFSGTFHETKMTGNQVYNFNDTFNLLDVDEKKLYQINHIKNY